MEIKESNITLTEYLVEIKSLEHLNDLIDQNKYIVLDFYSPKCNPCNKIKPSVNNMAEINKDIVFGIVNILEHNNIKEKYNIKKIPSFVYIKNKKIVEIYTGADLTIIENNLNKYKDIVLTDDF